MYTLKYLCFQLDILTSHFCNGANNITFDENYLLTPTFHSLSVLMGGPYNVRGLINRERGKAEAIKMLSDELGI